MSDEPRDPADGVGADGVADVSAPWERPHRWKASSPESNRVEDLLTRIGSDEPGQEGRGRRRKAESGGPGAVPAGELIAALSRDDDPAADTANPEDTAHPDDTAGHPVESVLLPSPVDPLDPAPIRDLGDDPRTDVIPRVPGNAAELAQAHSIRAALHRQNQPADPAAVGPAGVVGVADPPPSGRGDVGGGTHTVHGSGQPRRRHRGWLIAGRSLAALVAVITLLGVGVEWKIKDRAEVSLEEHSVSIPVTNDTHISTARTKPTVVTNSAGVKTTESAAPVATYAPENILLLGSDTRSGSNGDAGNEGAGTNGIANSDTLMLAHISGDRQHVTILSIPRDTLIPAPTCKIWNSATGKVSDQYEPISAGQLFHINAAYSVGGPTCTVTAVQTLTGLGITRVIGIDFSGFQAMVNALGGITVDICRPIVDTVLGTVVPTAGSQVIGGRQALNLVRARDVVGDSQSDLARIHRQQIVLSAILRQVTQAGTLLNPGKLDNFLQAFTTNTFTYNVKLEDLITLAGSLGSLDPAHVTFYTLPTVSSTKINGALDVDQSKAAVVFDDLINDLPLPGEVTAAPTKVPTTPVAPTKTSAPSLQLTVSPAKVALEIYNLTGQTDIATTTQQRLDAVGFAVSEGQLFRPEGQTQTGTTVLYAPANRAAALTVAAAVPGSTLVVTPGLGSTVRLLLGSSYAGSVIAVQVGQQAPQSLATAVSTGSSISTNSPAAGTTLGSTDLSSVNAAAGSCA